MKEINVLDTKITYYNTDNEDYISLTDMLKSKELYIRTILSSYIILLM